MKPYNITQVTDCDVIKQKKCTVINMINNQIQKLKNSDAFLKKEIEQFKR